MITITYGPIYKPKLQAQQYDWVLKMYDEQRAVEAIRDVLKNINDDIYIEYGLAYVPSIRNFMFSSIDYTLIYIPRSVGLNIYVPKSKIGEFIDMLTEYEKSADTLRDFIMGKLKERHIPYFYPPVALYCDNYIYLYIGGVEVALPGCNE